MSIKMRTQKDIDEQMNLSSKGVENGSKWPGMSYEEGVSAALEWVCGLSDEAPMAEEE